MEPIDILATLYARALKKYPVPVGISTAVAALLTALIVVFTLRQQQLTEQQRIASVGYGEQLTRIDGVQQSLKNLSEFVAQQRTRLQESEQVVSKLQEEKQRIEPVIQADRRTIDAVFQLQEQRSSSSLSRERWIGFVLGIVASLLASFIYAVIVYFWRKSHGSENRTAI